MVFEQMLTFASTKVLSVLELYKIFWQICQEKFAYMCLENIIFLKSGKNMSDTRKHWMPNKILKGERHFCSVTEENFMRKLPSFDY